MSVRPTHVRSVGAMSGKGAAVALFGFFFVLCTLFVHCASGQFPRRLSNISKSCTIASTESQHYCRFEKIDNL